MKKEMKIILPVYKMVYAFAFVVILSLIRGVVFTNGYFYDLFSLLKEIRKLDNINKVIEELTTPPGRMDIIRYNDNNIVVDYAHTPDAVEKIIKELKI